MPSKLAGWWDGVPFDASRRCARAQHPASCAAILDLKWCVGRATLRPFAAKARPPILDDDVAGAAPRW